MEVEIPELAGAFADHTSCWISVLRVLQHKGTEGQRKQRNSLTEH